MRHRSARSVTAILATLALVSAACSAATPGSSAAVPSAGGSAGQASPSEQASAAAPTTAATTAASSGATGTGTRDEVCEAGRAEGKVVYWSNFANPDPIFEAFNAEYPEIEVELLSRHPDEHVQAALTEHTAGRQLTADLMYAELNVMNDLIPLGIIDEATDWPALGVPAALIPEPANVVRLYRVAGGLVYNTDNHTADDLPDTWEELIDPKWDSQIVVDPRGRPFDQLSLVWGHDQTIDYVNRLNDLNPIVIEGGTAGMVAVSSGQAAITTGGRSAETFEQQAAGAPLEIKYLDVITSLDTYNVMFAQPQHPNAAKCLVAWLATDGQAAHDEAEFKSNQDVPPGAPEGAEPISVDTPEQTEQVDAIGEEIGRIFTGT